MNTLIFLSAIVTVVSCLPAKLDSVQEARGYQSPTLVKDFTDMQVQINEVEKGKYTLKVYQNDGSHKVLVPTTTWKVPNTWRAPGQSTARVVHAELLSNGDVVIVLFSHETGLELILLPRGFIQEDNGIVTEASRPISFPGQPIIFPDFTVPWHPTVSTPPDNWEWVSLDTEVTTPTTRVSAKPEKNISL